MNQCTHPPGCTHCNWCGFKATDAELQRARMWQMMLDQIPLTRWRDSNGQGRPPTLRHQEHVFNRFNF